MSKKKQATPPGSNLSPLEKARLARQANKVPENETKRERFERVAGQRMTVVLAALQRLGSASSSQYEYTVDDIRVMRATLEDAIIAVIRRFEPREAAKEAPKFSFAGSKPAA